MFCSFRSASCLSTSGEKGDYGSLQRLSREVFVLKYESSCILRDAAPAGLKNPAPCGWAAWFIGYLGRYVLTEFFRLRPE
jgi:hypothetical protein